MDFDLYDDLLVGEEESPPTEKEKQLMEENEALKKEKLVFEEKMRILVGVNRKLSKQKEILEQNISSLLKTARTEINRKHETITTLKREIDNLVLRRSLKLGTRKEYEEVFATITDAMSKCGDYTKKLPVPGNGDVGNDGNFYIKTLDNHRVQTVVCGNSSFSVVKHGEVLSPSKVVKFTQEEPKKRKRDENSFESPPSKKITATPKDPAAEFEASSADNSIEVASKVSAETIPTSRSKREPAPNESSKENFRDDVHARRSRSQSREAASGSDQRSHSKESDDKHLTKGCSTNLRRDCDNSRSRGSHSRESDRKDDRADKHAHRNSRQNSRERDRDGRHGRIKRGHSSETSGNGTKRDHNSIDDYRSGSRELIRNESRSKRSYSSRDTKSEKDNRSKDKQSYDRRRSRSRERRRDDPDSDRRKKREDVRSTKKDERAKHKLSLPRDKSKMDSERGQVDHWNQSDLRPNQNSESPSGTKHESEDLNAKQSNSNTERQPEHSKNKIRCQNVDDSSSKPEITNIDLEEGEISSEDDEDTHSKKSTTDRPNNVVLLSQEIKKTKEPQTMSNKSISNGAGIEEQKTVSCQDARSGLKSDSDKNSEDPRKGKLENSAAIEKHVDRDEQTPKSNEIRKSSESQRINVINEKAGTKDESNVDKLTKTKLGNKFSSDISEKNFDLEKINEFEAKPNKNTSSEKPKEKSANQEARQEHEDESMETSDQDSCPTLNHSRVTQTFLKVGSFSSEDSFGCVESSSKATDFPDDLTNVDTVELDSLIQEKRDLFKQLEEKQKRYLKKMNKASTDQVCDEFVEYPKIISVTDQESEMGQGLKIRISLPSRRNSQSEAEHSNPDVQKYTFQPIQPPVAIEPEHAVGDQEPTPSISDNDIPSAFDVAEGSGSKPVTCWNVKADSSKKKRLTPILETETSSEAMDENVQIPGKPDASANQQFIIGLNMREGESPRTRSNSTQKSPSERPLASSSAQQNLPCFEIAQGALDSPNMARLKTSQGATSGIAGCSSPEMSAVQWGLVGSQNLFSDGWNSTPSPRCLQQTRSVDFSSTAGIASILKGELVTSGYISPGSGIIRTPTPTHMKTKLYTEPYSGVTPRRSPRRRFVLSPSSESKSLQCVESDNLTPGKDSAQAFPRRKPRNKKELFKSCGLEESCSNSNFESAIARDETASTKSSEEKQVFDFGLAKTSPVPREGLKSKDSSKSGGKNSKCRNSSKSDEKNSRSRERISEKSSKTVKEEKPSSVDKEQSYKRTLTFSPEFQTSIPADKTSRRTSTTSKSSECTTRVLDRVKESKNQTTGLSLSTQILASYGLNESHSLEPVRGSSSKSGSKFSLSKTKIGEGIASAEVSNSKKLDNVRADVTKSSTSKLSNGLKKNSPSRKLLASCGLEDSPVKGSSETNIFTKPRKNSPSRKLLASCGLEDSPVKSSSEKSSETNFLSKQRKNSPSLLASCGLEDNPVTLSESSQNKCQSEKKKPEMEATSASKKESNDKIQDTRRISTCAETFNQVEVVSSSEVSKEDDVKNKKEGLGNAENPSKGDTPTDIIVKAKSSKRQKKKKPFLSMSTQSLASFMPDDKPEGNVADSTTISVVSTSVLTLVSTSEDNNSKRNTISPSINSKVLATCVPDNISTKEPVTSSVLHFSTEKQNLSMVVDKVEKSSKSSSRLSTPSKKLASSLGLDMSSSSGESSDEEDKGLKNTKVQSPIKVSTVEKQRGVKPSKKKIQLGHSTKENQVDFVFRN